MSTEGLKTIIGRSRSDAFVGLTASTEEVLLQRSFDLAFALLSTAEADSDHIPDAAYTLLLHRLILDFVARRMPGPGSDIMAEEIRFLADPAVGETVTITGTITERPTEDTAHLAILVESPRCRLAESKLTLRLPAEPVSFTPASRPDIVLHSHKHLERLMNRSSEVPPIRAAVVWPCDRDSLLGACLLYTSPSPRD